MYHLRPFHNSDPPHLAEVWRSQPPERGRMLPVTTAMLEQAVFCKLFFEPEGLIVAEHEGKPIGFAHAGFGPASDRRSIDTSVGVVHLVMLHSGYADDGAEDQLLAAAEAYLRRQGAAALLGGGSGSMSGFYLGLYGGSQDPGVLGGDRRQADLYARNGFVPHRTLAVLQRDLGRFRPPVSRSMRQLKREAAFETDDTPAPASWWDACVLGGIDHTRFSLVDKKSGEPLARVSIWDVEPIASSWGLRTAGVFDLWVRPERRREGVAQHLLSEAFAVLRRRGYALVEAQTPEDNEEIMGLVGDLGLTTVDRGTVYLKS